MKRWHEDRELMLRRWREEIAKHEDLNIGALGQIPPVGGSCHCYRGCGTMRKRTVYGCSTPRCGICHFEKHYGVKARNTSKKKAIEFDLNAY